MALAKLTDLQKLAMDCYEGRVKNYTNGNPEDVLRNMYNGFVMPSPDEYDEIIHYKQTK